MPELLQHKTWCAFVRSHPSEGDEAALCNCGAVEDAVAEHLEHQERTRVQESDDA